MTEKRKRIHYALIELKLDSLTGASYYQAQRILDEIAPLSAKLNAHHKINGPTDRDVWQAFAF